MRHWITGCHCLLWKCGEYGSHGTGTTNVPLMSGMSLPALSCYCHTHETSLLQLPKNTVKDSNLSNDRSMWLYQWQVTTDLHCQSLQLYISSSTVLCRQYHSPGAFLVLWLNETCHGLLHYTALWEQTLLSHDVLAPASVPSVYTHEPKSVTVELCNNYQMSLSNSAEVPRHNIDLFGNSSAVSIKSAIWCSFISRIVF